MKNYILNLEHQLDNYAWVIMFGCAIGVVLIIWANEKIKGLR